MRVWGGTQSSEEVVRSPRGPLPHSHFFAGAGPPNSGKEVAPAVRGQAYSHPQ